jgi:hypothetical protein
MKLKTVYPGKWEDVPCLEVCCDCGLAHRLQYRLKVVGKTLRIQVAAWRDKRTTKIARRQKQYPYKKE